MRLSELSTDRALDALCELMPSVSSIMEDEEILADLDNVMSEYRPADAPDGDTEKQDSGRSHLDGIKMLGGMVKITSVLLKKHRQDVYNILSIMHEKSVVEIASQPIIDTVQQVREVFQDSDLLSFFKSSTQRGQNEPSVPSAGSHGSK